jgi:hypothetical protein
MRRCLDQEGRKTLAAAAGHANAALTSDEAIKKEFRRLERQEQRLLASWLHQQKEAGRLNYNWSRTDRRTTNRAGTPDFEITKNGSVLFGEMKIDRNTLSPAQKKMHDEHLRSGTEVEIWSCADVAIRRINNWIWTEFREWSENEHTTARN